MELLMKLPRERWADRNCRGYTLLHIACTGPDQMAVVALIQNKLVDVNSSDCLKWTPVHFAVMYRQIRAVEILCAAGANLKACDVDGNAPIDHALMPYSVPGDETARALIANGVRLNTVNKKHQYYIDPELMAFERGVLRCRSAAVAMMRVKRAGKLARWDKFLLKEMTICVWATRYDKAWSQE